MELCTTQGKVKYNTLPEAIQVAISMVTKKPETRPGLRAYICIACSTWHLGHRATKHKTPCAQRKSVRDRLKLIAKRARPNE